MKSWNHAAAPELMVSARARRKAKAIICPVSRCMIALAPLPQSLRFTGVRRLSDIPCTPAKRLCLQRERNIAMSTGRRCAGKGFSNDLTKLFQLMNSFFQRMAKFLPTDEQSFSNEWQSFSQRMNSFF
ncbi:hypothetical protein FIN92_06160 [Prevotella brunnea]|nr:hypothetical protein [Prevotella brunnea]MDR0186162.1 hypothetical protein [Prevotella brunnea]